MPEPYVNGSADAAVARAANAQLIVYRVQAMKQANPDVFLFGTVVGCPGYSSGQQPKECEISVIDMLRGLSRKEAFKIIRDLNPQEKAEILSEIDNCPCMHP